ncbi:MAG TPA: hypothetical protein VGN20_03930 [Mucilaginibacter sp.]|jgi:hypothetical protein
MNLKKIALIIFVAIMLLIGVGELFSSQVSKQNSTCIKGHFISLQKEVNRGDVSYDLYLAESNDYYKISAEWARCFLADNFLSDVKPGQQVELYVAKNAIPFFKSSVASLSSDGKSYLIMDCVNNDIDRNRYLMPLASLGISIFAITLFLVDEKKKKEKPMKKRD